MLSILREAWRAIRVARGTTILAFVIVTIAIAAGTVTSSMVGAQDGAA